MKKIYLTFLLASLAFIVNAQTTQLRSVSCGATISDLNDYIYVDHITNAEDYEYNFVHAASSYDQTITKGYGVARIRLKYVPGIDYGKTYDVRVRVKVSGVWGSYGPVCQITTGSIPTTQLSSNSCGATISDLNDYIYVDHITNAEDYEYNFVHAASSYDQTIANGNGVARIRLKDVPGIDYGKTYDVRVRVKVSGVWGSYGPVCQITTGSIPTTQLSSNSCGATISDLNDYIYVDHITNAEDYEYNFVHAASSYDQTIANGNGVARIRLKDVPGIDYGKTYDVRVRVKVSGVWGSYGPVCQITTGSIPTTQLSSNSCGATISDLNDYIYVDHITNAEDYEYNFVHAASSYDQTIANGNGVARIRLKDVPGIDYGKTYDVRVRVKVSGVWGSYGPVCQITTGSIPTTQLSSNSCGATISDLNDYIYVDHITNAEDYEYNFVHAASSYDQTIANGNGVARIRLKDVPGIDYGKTYDVRVRVKVSGVWSSYGPVCQITTGSIPTTQLSINSCGATISDLNDYIYTNPVGGAEDYEYNFVHAASSFDQTETVGSAARALQLKNVSGIDYGKTYDVRVRVKVSGVWGSYGPVCQITTGSIPTTQLSSASCGATISDLNDYIYIDHIENSEDYEYNFVHAASSYDQTITKGYGVARIRLKDVPGIDYGKTYDVRVRARVNGVWGSYGPVCQITTGSIPTTQLSGASCGATISDLNDYIYIDHIENSEDYEYNFVHAASSYDQTITKGYGVARIRLKDVPGIDYGKTYDVRVRVKVSGVWGSYGPVCQITTGSIPTTQLSSNSCGATISDLNDYIYIDPVGGAEDYEYNFVNSSSSYNDTVAAGSATTKIQLNQVPGIDYGKTYDVRVRAKVNGSWGDFGNICIVTTENAVPPMSPISQKKQNDIIFKGSELSLYPNPFKEVFTFSLNTEEQESATIYMLDLSGRIIYNERIQTNMEYRFDESLKEGVYIIKAQTDSGLQLTKKILKTN